MGRGYMGVWAIWVYGLYGCMGYMGVWAIWVYVGVCELRMYATVYGPYVSRWVWVALCGPHQAMRSVKQTPKLAPVSGATPVAEGRPF